ncbi:hypothetical protein PV08_05303 [Exophiala spinifera]|uniref:Uncharacterized protein n=1 Tax=Exophiala spinifera TaxID=91928 RepID=A0A0D2B8I4_9EURO|nr:uncharacterized protein PV08_05303 [Exophiala spinifera]KIW15258.1 hypothetical protein PV08_05303 [Exophiala spinifera]
MTTATIFPTLTRIKKDPNINKNDVLYAEQNLPLQYRDLLMNNRTVYKKVRKILGRYPILSSPAQKSTSTDVESPQEIDGTIPLSAVGGRKKSLKRTRNQEVSEHDGDVTPETTGHPTRKKARVNAVALDLSGHIRLQKFLDKSKQVGLPEMPKDTEVPVGFWSLDPNPQRLVTVEIQRTGRLGFFVRNLTRQGMGIVPSDEYGTAADSMMKLEMEDAKRLVDWHPDCKKAGADTSVKMLTMYAFAYTENKAGLIPWSSGADIFNFPGLGTVYEFLSGRATRWEAELTFGRGWSDRQELLLRCLGLICQMENASTQAKSCSEKMFEILGHDVDPGEKAERMFKVFKDLTEAAGKPLKWALKGRAIRYDSVEINQQIPGALLQAVKDDYNCAPKRVGPGWILKRLPRTRPPPPEPQDRPA